MIELIAFVLVSLLVLALLREIRKQQTQKAGSSKRSTASTHLSGVKRETQNRLYAMCGGDREVVLRLTRGGG